MSQTDEKQTITLDLNGRARKRNTRKLTPGERLMAKRLARAMDPALLDDDWRTLCAAYSHLLTVKSGRGDLRFFSAPGAAETIGAHGFYQAETAQVVVDGNLLPCAPSELDPANDKDHFKGLAEFHGVFIHEAGHATHTFSIEIPKDTPKDVQAAAQQLEEIRMEARVAEERPADVRWITAAMKKLHLPSMTGDAALQKELGIGAKMSLALTALFTEGRVHAGTLKAEDTKTISKILDQALPADKRAELDAIFAEAVKLRDDEQDKLLELGYRMVAAFPDEKNCPVCGKPVQQKDDGSAQSSGGSDSDDKAGASGEGADSADAEGADAEGAADGEGADADAEGADAEGADAEGADAEGADADAEGAADGESADAEGAADGESADGNGDANGNGANGAGNGGGTCPGCGQDHSANGSGSQGDGQGGSQGDGQGGSQGDVQDQSSGQGQSGTSDEDMERARQAAEAANKEIDEAADRAMDDLKDDPDAQEAMRDIAENRKTREEIAQMSAATGGLQAGSPTGLQPEHGERHPTDEEKSQRVHMSRKLKKVRWRERAQTKRNMRLPAGRLRGRAMIAQRHDESRGVPSKAEPWSRKIRKPVTLPSVTCAIMVDTSGSMGNTGPQISGTMWVLANAIAENGGKTAGYAFGNGTSKVLEPHKPPRFVTDFKIAGGTAGVPKLIEESNKDLDWENAYGAKLLVIVTDGCWYDGGEAAEAMEKLRAKGVRVMVVGVGDDPNASDYPTDEVVTIHSIEDLTPIIGNAAIRALREF